MAEYHLTTGAVFANIAGVSFMFAAIGLFVAGFLAAYLIGSLAEYFIHVFMHRRILLGKIHTMHHKEGWGQGVWAEFLNYIIPAAPFIAGMAAIDWFVCGLPWLAIGTTVGGVWFCGFSAYTHQLSHERPEMVFWLRFPSHYMHHYHNMWHHNFGTTTLLWDRLFGTYKDVDWKPANRFRFVNFFRIHWIGANPMNDFRKHNLAGQSEQPVPTA